MPIFKCERLKQYKGRGESAGVNYIGWACKQFKNRYSVGKDDRQKGAG